jgi:tripeptide aminopeptidase
MDQVRKEVLERFLRYVKIDTQSREESTTHPSTQGQWELLRLLEAELKELGLREVTLSPEGVLTADLPANPAAAAAPPAPTIAFLAHVDTYHGTSGKDVRPQVIENYDGKDIRLAGSGEYLKVAENPDLKAFVGETVLTSDGTTLLGADDKAGVAEIMTFLSYAGRHREFIHGPLKVAFTPDEEIGQGTHGFPELEKFGVHVAYTVDGGPEGEVEDETFCADTATVTLIGKDVHPGYAKGKMINAVRAAAHLVSLLPKESLPESTEGRQGYLHPLQVNGDVNKVTIPFLVRDFRLEALKEWEALLEGLAKKTVEEFPGLRYEFKTTHSYKNMRYYLDKEPRAVELAMQAVKAAGLAPRLLAIRGGTDGSRLSEKGLPTPNLFGGGRNFHSINEWIPLPSMVQSVQVLVELAKLWAQVKR